MGWHRSADPWIASTGQVMRASIASAPAWSEMHQDASSVAIIDWRSTSMA